MSETETLFPEMDMAPVEPIRPLPPEFANDWLMAACASLTGYRARYGVGTTDSIPQLAAADADSLLREFMNRFPSEVPTGEP